MVVSIFLCVYNTLYMLCYHFALYKKVGWTKSSFAIQYKSSCVVKWGSSLLLSPHNNKYECIAHTTCALSSFFLHSHWIENGKAEEVWYGLFFSLGPFWWSEESDHFPWFCFRRVPLEFLMMMEEMMTMMMRVQHIRILWISWGMLWKWREMEEMYIGSR